MMSAQNQVQHGVIQSSIALLQERFKQLQRVKEMREKKELIRVFSDHNNNKDTPFDSYNYEPSSASHITTNNDANDNDDDELQIFLPPNYYHSNYSRKPSCYSSSTSPPSSSLSHSNHNYHNFNDISLSLWPPMSYSNNTTTSTVTVAERFRRSSFEAPVPVSLSKMSRPSSCVSSAYKFEDSHVSDVDTTLHL